MDLVSGALWGIAIAMGSGGLALFAAIIAYRGSQQQLQLSVSNLARAVEITEKRLFVLLQISLDLAQRLGIDKRYSDELLRAYTNTLSREDS